MSHPAESSPITPPSTGQLLNVVRQALDDLKAKDVRKLDVRGRTGFTDYMFFASGTSSRHVKSIADEVQKQVKAVGLMPLGVEGETRRRVGVGGYRKRSVISPRGITMRHRCRTWRICCATVRPRSERAQSSFIANWRA